MTPVRPARRRPDRGSVSVEVAILTPAFLLLMVLAAIAGRTAVAQSTLQMAAHDAARAASISRTATVAADRSRDAVLQRMNWEGLRCVGQPDVQLSGWIAGRGTVGFAEVFDEETVGEAASVTVRISCEVTFADLARPADVPGSRVVEATFTSAVDRYRGRG
ncbi:TadE/TadG family type IV pilus assembly protein [Polymorphospora sp. NPDC050346]|uniref:TadE/TadG family type IV pilus assembly protein n=1 Tax=Polymorphospora sp. NPDC050346 TaxID=3155780 RepID=UPI0033C0FB51